jgi:hypothetical protein
VRAPAPLLFPQQQREDDDALLERVELVDPGDEGGAALTSDSPG